MIKIISKLPAVLVLLGVAGIAAAQNQPDVPASEVVTQSIKSMGYTVKQGTTMPFVATKNAPQASGEAKVEAKPVHTTVDFKAKGLPQPWTLGPEFLTYILWRVTPDGNTAKLGEVSIDKDGNGELEAKTSSQTFAMALTAEPYFAVQLPSEMVVLVNDPSKKTKGKLYPENSYKLMTIRQYAKQGNPLGMTLDLKNTPLEVYQARNAVEIAKSRRAPEFAPDIYKKADGSLQLMERDLASHADKKIIITDAKQTVQFAEDARALSSQTQEALRIQKEKEDAAAAAAASAAATANAQAAAEAKRQAELTAAKEGQMKAEAAAAAAQSQAKEDAARAEAQRAKAATEALRAQLLSQLNAVLQTTDSPRGLVVNMGDVLFETAKYALSTDAKLKLARLSGVILSHPGLNLAIEGHTDSTGTDEFNLKLSQQRAETVREFLISQGLSADSVTAAGMGPANPIADNTTAAGRQQNRRVEIIVSGEVIGTKMAK